MSDNKFFNFIGQEPYEIGSLLRAIPHAHLIGHVEPAGDRRKRLEAVVKHAGNARDVLHRGLAAVGKTLSAGASNSDFGLPLQTVENIGGLVQYLAVELEYLTELHDECQDELQRATEPKRGAK